MLIVCPACASEYEIAADRVGASGRSVRCAACRETWFIAPDAASAAESADVPAGDFGAVDADSDRGGAREASAAAASPADMPVEPAATFDRSARASRRGEAGSAAESHSARPTTRPAMSAALAAGLVLFALVPLVLLGRATVVRAAPQTAALFSGIGLPVNLRGIAFRDVAAFQTPADGDKPAELVVEGDLVGVARDRTDVPPILIEIRDDHGTPLHHWTIPSPRAALESAETARFHASLAAPPAQGRDVQVRFADAENPEADRAEAGHSAAEAGATPHAGPRDAAAGHAPGPGH